MLKSMFSRLTTFVFEIKISDFVLRLSRLFLSVVLIINICDSLTQCRLYAVFKCVSTCLSNLIYK